MVKNFHYLFNKGNLIPLGTSNINIIIMFTISFKSMYVYFRIGTRVEFQPQIGSKKNHWLYTKEYKRGFLKIQFSHKNQGPLGWGS